MKVPEALRDPVLWLLLAGVAALAGALWNPGASWRTGVRDYLAVVDVTQSMNARDYLHQGHPRDRLSQARAFLSDLTEVLPCGSRLGLGVFAGWQTEVLVEPVAVCRHRPELKGIIENLHWQMGWVPQSNVLRGIDATLEGLPSLSGSPALVFLTDGDEAPPRWQEDIPPLEEGARERNRGLLVGVGTREGSPVPQFNQKGQQTGFFTSDGERYRSALDEGHLRRVAKRSGLDYRRLGDGEKVTALLASERYLRTGRPERDLGRSFAWAGLALLLAAHLVELLSWGRFGPPTGR